MKRYTYYIIAMLTLLSACGDTEYEYSSEPCYLVFDNAASRSIKLAEAMNPVSPGIFCHISLFGKKYIFETTAAVGQKEEVNFTAKDEKVSKQLGTYNVTGLIVGYGNLNSPATFYAYDMQCPNCYKETYLPQYAMTLESSGKVKCSKCDREYDLNNEGIVSKGEGGDKLMRYRASTTGPQGVLYVTNG